MVADQVPVNSKVSLDVNRGAGTCAAGGGAVSVGIEDNGLRNLRLNSSSFNGCKVRRVGVVAGLVQGEQAAAETTS